jgi:hypothetical protein
LLSHTQKYEAAWADLRLRGRILLGVSLGFVPGVPLLSYAIAMLYPIDPLWIGGAWLAAFAGAAVHRSTFTCPRCGHWFFVWLGYHNTLTRKCIHCDLKIGAHYEAPPPIRLND